LTEKYSYEVKVDKDRINPYAIRQIIDRLPGVKVRSYGPTNPYEDSERKTEGDSNTS
jgi:hypothetical protein